MREPCHPILVRVPEQLADRLTAEAAEAGKSRHALMLDKLEHRCEPADEPADDPCLSARCYADHPGMTHAEFRRS